MAHPVFQFRNDGSLLPAPPGTRPSPAGVRLFMERYAREWALWHSAGCSATGLMDLAALKTSFLHLRTLPLGLRTGAEDWVRESFLIPLDLPPEAFGMKSLPAGTLLALADLRQGTRDSRVLPEDRDEELLSLALPLEHILIAGGDQRLSLDPETLLNGYGCRPFPRPEAITFASSTATSVSQHAFGILECLRAALIRKSLSVGVGEAVDAFCRTLREDLAGFLGIAPGEASVIFSSSGTDSYLVTSGLLSLLTERQAVTVMAGADESGTGVPLAARERHFAPVTAMGGSVPKGSGLVNPSPWAVGEAGGFHKIPLHDGNGRSLPSDETDQRASRLVRGILNSGRDVVLHAMNHSKLGRSGPSPSLLASLKAEFGARLEVVVDACQMRLDPPDLRAYLELGFLVIVTGSKFFTGPPLSGALLIPGPLAGRLRATGTRLSPAFGDYLAGCDLPPDLRHLLPGGRPSLNLGAYFRWAAALEEMRRYHRIPADIRRKTIGAFCDSVGRLLSSREFLHPAEEAPRNGNAAPGELSGRRMIFPFFLLMPGRGERPFCDEAEMRRIYRLLNTDCSGLFPSSNAREHRLLSQCCHIGQPVPARAPDGSPSAMLRISVGARVLTESWNPRSAGVDPHLIHDEEWQVGVVLDKIALLLGHLATETPSASASSTTPP